MDKNKWKDKEEGLSERLQNSPLKMAVERFGLLICACVCVYAAKKAVSLSLTDVCTYFWAIDICADSCFFVFDL